MDPSTRGCPEWSSRGYSQAAQGRHEESLNGGRTLLHKTSQKDHSNGDQLAAQSKDFLD